jgi:hypothetical protein
MVKGRLDQVARAHLDELVFRLHSLSKEIALLSAKFDSLRSDTSAEVAALRTDLIQRHTEAMGKFAELRGIVAADFDRVPELRRQLLLARSSHGYRKAFDDPQPLVSVPIATYNRGQLLLDRTIPSALAQTYKNIEVIVVGDGCNDDTFERLAQLSDPRITFVNLPHRGVYPEQPMPRWMVAGAPAMNEAAQRARGEWIAPLDDDDEFLAEHVEQLLETARDGRFEMVYGKLQVKPDPPLQSYEVGVYPPTLGQFGFQGALYMTILRFFEHDLKAWVLEEPADWNMCRRMIEAGVRIGWVDRPVTVLDRQGPRLRPTS